MRVRCAGTRGSSHRIRGRERLRPSPMREVLVQAPVLSTIRQRVVPRRWSQSLKRLWRARVEPPRLTPVLTARLSEVFDADLAQLGSWLGYRLDCENFHEATVARAHEWAAASGARERGRLDVSGRREAGLARPRRRRRTDRVDRDDLGADQLVAGLEPIP